MTKDKRFVINKDERNPVIQEITKNGMLWETYVTVEEIVDKTISHIK